MRTALDCFNSNKGEEGQQQGYKTVGDGWNVAALPHLVVLATLLRASIAVIRGLVVLEK